MSTLEERRKVISEYVESPVVTLKESILLLWRFYKHESAIRAHDRAVIQMEKYRLLLLEDMSVFKLRHEMLAKEEE